MSEPLVPHYGDLDQPEGEFDMPPTEQWLVGTRKWADLNPTEQDELERRMAAATALAATQKLPTKEPSDAIHEPEA